MNGVWPADAAGYKPGTVGYLYESCRDALKNSENLVAFDGTYCGGFIEGYTVGVATNAPVLPPPAENDPCYEAKKKEYEKINGRFCANLPSYATVSIADAKSVAPKAADIFFRWIDFLKKEKGGKKALGLPVTTQLNAMIGEGNFCDQLVGADPKNAQPAEINPALAGVNLMQYVDMQWRKTLKDKYDNCAADIAQARRKGTPFLAERCGAEITGFITGVMSAPRMKKNSRTPEACRKQISRLYRTLDPAESMCVTDSTRPYDVAKMFFKRVEELRAGQSASRVDAMPGYGAAGYQPVFYGLMCRK